MMVNKNPARVDSRLAANLVFRRKSRAFVITCAATFLFLVTVYSMSVRGFVSESMVRLAINDILDLDEDQVRKYVAQTWKRQLADKQLECEIDQLRQMMHLKHPVMLGKNLDRLRKQLGYELNTDLDNGVCEVRLQIEGDGCVAESALLKRVAQNLAGGISNIASTELVGSDELLAEVDVAAELHQTQNENVDRVEQLVEQLESELESLRSAMHSNGTPFRNVVHSSKSTSVDSITAAVDALDLSSLRSTIAKIRQVSVEQFEIQKKQLVSSAQAPNRTAAFLLQGVSISPSRPIGGVPTAAVVASFVLLSLFVGSIVTWGYSPLQDETGFASAQQVKAKLNLPVFATLKRTSEISESDDEIPLANLVFQLAKITLLGILLIVAAGIVISPTIRSSFVENPFHGFSHIVWNLLGK